MYASEFCNTSLPKTKFHMQFLLSQKHSFPIAFLFTPKVECLAGGNEVGIIFMQFRITGS